MSFTLFPISDQFEMIRSTISFALFLLLGLSCQAGPTLFSDSVNLTQKCSGDGGGGVGFGDDVGGDDVGGGDVGVGGGRW